MAIPAIIDSTGKPGTAGITSGVVVELEDSVTVTVSAELVLVVSLNTLDSAEVCSVLLVVVAWTVLVSVELVEVEVTVAVLLVAELVVDVD